MENQNYCIVCGQNNVGGILIRDKYICPNCEHKIVALTVDHPDYDLIKDSLKQIWFPTTMDNKTES